MCHPVRCRTCGLVTWRGCGAHVAQLKAQVPAEAWCPGHPRADGEEASGGGLLRRLFGR